MKIFVLVLMSFFIFSCSHDNNCEDGTVVEVDSLELSPQLRSILYLYMASHPKYKNLVLYTDLLEAWRYKTENSYFSIEPMLYYDFSNKESRERGCPTSYVTLYHRKIFIASRLDNLFMDKVTRSFVKQNSLPNNITYLRGYQGWYIEVNQNGKYKILTKQCAGFYFDTIKIRRMESIIK